MTQVLQIILVAEDNQDVGALNDLRSDGYLRGARRGLVLSAAAYGQHGEPVLLARGDVDQSLAHQSLGRYDFRDAVAVGDLEEVAVIVVTLLLTGFLFLFFQRTRLGLAMQAASQNQLAAYYMGVPVKRVQGLIWGLSGAVAAVAGILFATKGAVDPSTGLLGIKAFAAAVIGGFGSLPGALIGGLIVGVIEPFAARYLPPGYSQIAPYALLLLVLIFRPSGLFSQMRLKKV